METDYSIALGLLESSLCKIFKDPDIRETREYSVGGLSGALKFFGNVPSIWPELPRDFTGQVFGGANLNISNRGLVDGYPLRDLQLIAELQSGVRNKRLVYQLNLFSPLQQELEYIYFESLPFIPKSEELNLKDSLRVLRNFRVVDSKTVKPSIDDLLSFAALTEAVITRNFVMKDKFNPTDEYHFQISQPNPNMNFSHQNLPRNTFIH
jgi:hypothetical protein